MVLLAEIRATPHPDGHRIDLTWANPQPGEYPGVRIVRREGTHPTAPDDGVVVADGLDLSHGLDEQGRALYRVADTGLRGTTTYYYGLFPYRDDPPEFVIERSNRAAALAGARYDTAERMFRLLPAIYHRYDADGGQLHRFLQIPGGQLDLLQSYTSALLDAYDTDRTDGRMLPLLAGWIGWNLDFRLEIDAQRNEVRHAPSIYQRIGLIPVVAATVKRISGWESRTKEFVHNVFRSNEPERLNIWVRRMDEAGTTVVPDRPLSLNFAYAGRVAMAEDASGVRWLFYHTRRRGRWRIWRKTSPAFLLGFDARVHLEGADIAGLQRAFGAVGIALAADATVSASGSLWRIDDTTNGESYMVEAGRRGLTVYRLSADPEDFAPSQPLNGPGVRDETHPAVALQQNTLWVFWSVYDSGTRRWVIRCRTRRDGRWSEVRNPFGEAPELEPQRRSPAVLVDGTDGLWLFWREQVAGRWLLRYNRFDPAGLPANPTDLPDPAAWQLAPAATFPLDGTDDPRVEDDPFVLFHPDDAARPIWVFWARKEPTSDPRQTRWSVAYRFKAGVDPNVADWSTVETLPKSDELAHDREPAAIVDGDGNLTVFFSSNRAGSWSIWRATLRLDAGPLSWESEEELTAPPYSQRAPLPLPIAGGTLLIHRSNESLEHTSEVYRASRTVDFRHAGATTVHTRNADQIDLRGAFEDLGSYTYDVGLAGARSDEDRYARDTIGVYVEPDTFDSERVARGIDRLRAVMPEFMPATDRAVFVLPDDGAHTEFVYSYARRGMVEPRFILEQFSESLSTVLSAALEPGEDFSDEIV